VNLKELSDLLSLSQTTVSRALNGYPEVREATRRRVQEAAAAYNYKPNTRAKSLATGRAMAIGHVIPFSTQHEMVNIIFSDFIAGAGDVYSRHGYDLLMSVVSDEDEAQAYENLAKNGAVDGVIVHGPTLDDPRIDLLRDLQLPFLVHGRSTHASGSYNSLDVNNRRAIERATEFLAELGHVRIALINGLEHLDFANRRRDGYEAGLATHGLSPAAELMRSSEMTEPYGYASACEMLDAANPPTAFIAASIVPALGIRRAIEERGLRIGRDVSIICFDDEISYLPNGAGEPIFTATRSSVRAAGRRCAELLLSQIADPSAPPVSEVWEADLVIGTSTGPAPVKPAQSSNT
jgi:LacI family transcriptional regulator